MAKSDDLKAQVLAAIRAGDQPEAVARRFGVDKSTVSRWKNALPSTELQQIATQKQMNLQTLVAGYLAENLQTLAAQAVHARDPNWLAKQDGQQLAILHGVMADKAIRILEAAAAAQPLENLNG